MKILLGLFLIVHGLVHLLYFGLSQSYFDLDTPLVGWPQNSWVLSPMLGESSTRSLASLLYLLATVVFIVSGIAVLSGIRADTALVVTASAFSSLVIILFWNGTTERLPDQGFVGVLINIVLVGIVALA